MTKTATRSTAPRAPKGVLSAVHTTAVRLVAAAGHGLAIHLGWQWCGFTGQGPLREKSPAVWLQHTLVLSTNACAVM